jgi:hypothetical protein
VYLANIGDENPLLLAVQRAQREAEQRRIMERALAEASDADKFRQLDAPSPGGTRERLRNLPVITKGVSGTQPGSSPLGALMAKEAKRDRREK